MVGSLRIGPIEVAVPMVLAPMAGITNAAYRQLCREQAEPAVADGWRVRTPAYSSAR